MKIFSVSIVLCILCHLSAAQPDNNSQRFTIKDCMLYALDNNIAVKQSELLIKSSENNFVQSRAGRYPTLNATFQHGLNSGRSVDPTTNQFVIQQIQASNMSLNLVMPLFNGFQQTNTIKRNNLNIEVNKLNTEQQQNTVLLNVAQQYLQVLQNQELLAAANQQIQVSRKQLERSEKLYQAGSIPITNLANLQAQVATDELSIINAENQLNLAKLNLMQQMNYPASDNFEIEKIPLPEDSEPVLAYPQTSSEIFDIAQGSQPNIKSNEKSEKVNELNTEISQGARYPTVNLIGTVSSTYSSGSKVSTFNTTLQNQVIGTVDGTGQTVSTLTPVTTRSVSDYPFTNQVDNNLSQYIGVQLRVPILNSWQVKTNIANNKIAIDNAKLNTQNSMNQLRQTIEQAYNDARSAANTYNAQLKQVAALQTAFDIADRNYSAGSGNAVDFDIALTNLNKAKNDLIRAKYTHAFRVKVLDFYANKPFTFED